MGNEISQDRLEKIADTKMNALTKNPYYESNCSNVRDSRKHPFEWPEPTTICGQNNNEFKTFSLKYCNPGDLINPQINLDCQRYRYDADPIKCCTNKNKYFINKDLFQTCDPIYRPENYKDGGCDDVMANYCLNPDNSFNEYCKKWINDTNNIFTKKSSSVVDDTIDAICKNPINSKKKECACITGINKIVSSLQGNKEIPLHCVLSDCTNNRHAYKTSSMLQTCNLTYCNVNLNNVKTAAKSAGIEINQNCGNVEEKTQPNTKTDTTNAEQNKKIIFAIIIMSVILITIAFIIFIINM